MGDPLCFGHVSMVPLAVPGSAGCSCGGHGLDATCSAWISCVRSLAYKLVVPQSVITNHIFLAHVGELEKILRGSCVPYWLFQDSEGKISWSSSLHGCWVGFYSA
ncbi:hypothetical protein TIFTF001_006105 [Ficus carica]|uniref:Uncharacterized protein n=1 Tax=Ficus carica TaxID=3494 RepID=A0AA88DFD5_FICCA|nr:hypothetical protein TIFTF001_006105 [Ficus carica]